MSTNHARDDWADPRTDEALRRELDALAGIGASASGLDDSLGTVRSRVRRRRAAKQAGLGVTTLAVAGGLVVGGASLLPEPPPDPLPAVSPTPSPSGSVDPTPSDDASAPTGAAATIITDGHQPSWLEGSGLECGMAATDLPASWDGAALLTTGEPADGVLAEPGTAENPAYAEVGTRVEPAADVPAGAVLMGPTLLWVQDGVVVDLGTNTTENPSDLGGDPLELTAEDSVGTSCAPDGEVEGRTAYPHDLPPGRYEVQVFTTVWTDDFAQQDLLVTPGFAVTIDDDGTVRGEVPDATSGTESSTDTTSDATSDRSGEASGESSEEPVGAVADGTLGCSTSAADFVAPDLSGLPDPVRATAGELFDAVLDCDDTALAERAAADGTATNFGGRSPQEFWGLPDAEEHEAVYAILARLVTATGWTADTTGDGATYIWPRVTTAEHADDDAAWQEVVEAGVIDADLARDMRENEGYLGWRLGIHEDGTWWYYIAGD